jgi:hypothetical protein
MAFSGADAPQNTAYPSSVHPLLLPLTEANPNQKSVPYETTGARPENFDRHDDSEQSEGDKNKNSCGPKTLEEQSKEEAHKCGRGPLADQAALRFSDCSDHLSYVKRDSKRSQLLYL